MLNDLSVGERITSLIFAAPASTYRLVSRTKAVDFGSSPGSLFRPVVVTGALIVSGLIHVPSWYS